MLPAQLVRASAIRGPPGKFLSTGETATLRTYPPLSHPRGAGNRTPSPGRPAPTQSQSDPRPLTTGPRPLTLSLRETYRRDRLL
ncbi:hypothetical protein GCM10018775_04410 [Streptomyces umbrinus]|nr:hypothetical protein GCM10018775_04410 [Streptomyces umbrinus]